MTHCISVINVKGGVAKTTTVLDIAYGLGIAKRRVLILDMDPQCNASFALGGTIQFERSLLDVMLHKAPLDFSIIRQAEQAPNVWYAPGSLDLVAADLQLGAVPGREMILFRALAPIIKQFDYVLMDTNPHLGLLAVNAMVVARDTGMFLPVALNTFALVGFTILERVAQQLRDNLDIRLPVFGVLPTLYDSSTNISKDSLKVVQEHFGEKVFPLVIPRNIDIEKAHNRQGSIYALYPRSAGAAAYANATMEVIKRAEGQI